MQTGKEGITYIGKNNRYGCIRKIGEGGFGEVYAGFDYQLNKPVAIKIMKPKKSVGLPATTLREIGILKSFNHPNIVKALSIHHKKRKLFIIMEMMEGDLNHFLISQKSYDPLPVPSIKIIMKQLLIGVHYLHKNRVLHRDLKPMNLLLGVNYSGEPRIKIADFGLSRTIHLPLRPYSSGKGSIWYMAPEFWLGDKILATEYGIAVDIWSIGCIFLDLIFGTGNQSSGE